MLLLRHVRNAILHTRIDGHRKARVEKILDRLGMTSTQAVNMLFAQVERRNGLPFPVTIEDNRDTVPPIKRVATVWGDLERLFSLDTILSKKTSGLML